MPRLKAVIFDIDGVLIDSINANANFFLEVFKSHNISFKKKDYIHVNHMTMWDVIKHFSGFKSKARIKIIWQFAKKSQYPLHLVSSPKNALKVLSQLAKKYQLGLVTSRTKSGTSLVLKHFGYSKFFKTQICFEDIKNPKPHPEPLLKALKKMKIRASEAVYVGDMQSDISCAKAAGVYSILYKNNYSKVNSDKPDYTIKNFKQLLTTLNAISNS